VVVAAAADGATKAFLIFDFRFLIAGMAGRNSRSQRTRQHESAGVFFCLRRVPYSETKKNQPRINAD
jgi:hypothetical protein